MKDWVHTLKYQLNLSEKRSTEAQLSIKSSFYRVWQNDKIFLILIPVLFVFFRSNAQTFGGNSPRLKWRQIDTDTVRVIFPVGLEEQGQRVANLIHYMSRYNTRSIGGRLKKLNVVLQNQTLESNGHVGLAPYRSEFYLSPPQTSYLIGNNWLDVLTIHEYRHALQYANARRGLTRFVYYISGELGWGTMVGLGVPDWFMEGDAEVQETALSDLGRGRLPAFYNGYRSLLLSDKVYNYQKARNGSLKDFVPDHYKLGYLLCNYGRQQYGNDLWKGVFADAGKYKRLFYPFSRSLKHQTELNTKNFYKKAMQYYDSIWQRETKALKMDETERLNKVSKGKTYTSYRYPFFLRGDRILAHKISYKQIGGFYIIQPDGTEKLLFRQGITLDRYFAFRNDRIIWSEMGFDARWGWKNFSNIFIYDLKTGRKKKITTRQKYLSPDLAPGGHRIIVVRNSPEHKYALCVLDAKSGTMIKSLPNPDNYYFSYPRWAPDNRHIVVVARDKKGKSTLMTVSVETGKTEKMLPWTSHTLGAPFPGKNAVYFPASFSGIDGIYAIRYGSREIFRIYEGKTGAYDVAADPGEKNLIFSEFTYLGNDLHKIRLDPSSWKSIQFVEPVDMPQYQAVAVKAEGGSIIEKVTDKKYPVKKYSQSAHPVNIHSWGLFFNDPSYELYVRSDNILNTLDVQAGVRYNRNDENFTWFGNLEYAQLFPVFFLNTNFVKNSQTFKTLVDDGQGNQDEITVRYNWNETVVQPGIRVPLNLSSGTYFRSMSLYSNFDYRLTSGQNLKVLDNDNYKPNNDLFRNFSRKSMTYGVLFLNSRMRAKQNIYPKFSQYLAVQWTHAIDTFNNAQLFVDSELTFPGLFVNHNFVVQASWQNIVSERGYRYPDLFRYARGYNTPHGYDQVYLIGLNYHMPLWYPDMGLAGIVYFYRLRTNFFFDLSQTAHTGTEGAYYNSYNSTGVELIFDTRLMNIYTLSFGVRYSYLLDTDPSGKSPGSTFEFFIPVMRF